jgi:hypothetical protein
MEIGEGMPATNSDPTAAIWPATRNYSPASSNWATQATIRQIESTGTKKTTWRTHLNGSGRRKLDEEVVRLPMADGKLLYMAVMLN